MPRFSAPITTLAGLVIVGAIATGCAGSGVAAAPAKSAAAAAPAAPVAKPTMELKVIRGPGTGTYTTDTTSSLNACTKAKDGSWRLLYAGGTPFVNLDFLAGPKAGQPDGADQVAAEIYAGPGYVRFDPAILRGGDAKGRSKATIAVSTTADATTFTVKATTPDMTNNEASTVDIDLTVTCQNPS
jgi:hypothetical protein